MDSEDKNARGGEEDLTFSREALSILVSSREDDQAAQDLHINMSPACDAEALLGVPDLALEKILYTCVECHTKLRHSFVCTGDNRLAQLGAPWTCCNACFLRRRPTLPADASFVHLTGVVPQRYAYHSFALRVKNRFQCYAPAQAVGEVSPADGTVHYVTYAELYDHARRLSTALQLTIGEGGVVCLRSENRGWWIAADAALAFGNYVCGPIATSVAPSAMRQMLRMTDAKVTVVVCLVSVCLFVDLLLLGRVGERHAVRSAGEECDGH